MDNPNCHRKECTRIRSRFYRFLSRRRPPRFNGAVFCSDACLFAHISDELTSLWRRFNVERGRRINRPKLGSILLEAGFVTLGQLEAAVRLQTQEKHGRLGEWLVHLGFAQEHQITKALARQYGFPTIKLQNSQPNPDAIRIVPGKVARWSNLLPVGFAGDHDTIRIALVGPVNFRSQQAIQRMIRKRIAAYIGDQSAIQNLMECSYKPEELDVSNVPSFALLEDVIEIVRRMAAIASDQRAGNMQAELLQDFLWLRLDFASESHHYFFRHLSIPLQSQEIEPKVAVGSRRVFG